MAMIDALRQQFPMYNDMDDDTVLEAYRSKYHADKTLEELQQAYAIKEKPTETVEPVQPTEPTDVETPAELPETGEALEIPTELIPPTPKTYESDEEKDKDDNLSFQELASDADYMEMLREYSTNRMGEEGAQGEDESNEDYLKRFLTHTREFEFNSIDLGQQLNWIRTADEEQRMKFGYLYSQLDRLPSFYEEGGTGYMSAMRDFGKSLLTDPLTYLGFGAGKVASTVGQRAITQVLKESGKKAALEYASKLSAKRMLGTKAGKIAAAGIAAEAGAATVQDLKLQEVEMLSKKYGDATADEYDLVRAGIVGTIGLGAGALGAKLSGGLGGEKLLTNARQARIKQHKINKELNSRNKTQAAEEAGGRSLEATHQSATGIFDTEAGRKTLDQLGELGEGADDMAQIQFRTELMQRVGSVVTNIVEDLAESGKLGEMVDVDTKASEVIGKIVTDSLKSVEGKSAQAVREQTVKMLGATDEAGEKGLLDVISGMDIDGDTLQSAISKAGITTEQFVDAFGTSYSDAGRYLQTASKVGQIMKGIREVDPELAKAVIGSSDAEKIVGPMGKLHGFIQRLDRERRALMVTQVATTVRNISTAVTRLTMDVAADAMESALYQIGRGSDAAMTGNAPVGFKGSIKNIVRDSFGRLDRMRQVTGTADLADALLKHNPRLAERMDRSLQEVDADQSLTRVTRALNGLNVAQDLFFRRAIFTDTIDKRLRRAGVIVDNPTKSGQYKSLEEFTAAGRSLPAKVLADAVEESLDFTFARMPKPGGKKAGDTVGHYFLKFNEAIGPVPIPLIGTASMPFGRFMVNALQFQMSYMPTSMVTAGYRYGMGKYTQALAKASKAAGNADLATKQGKQAAQAMADARSSFSKGIVGTAALYSAIKYRADNQDIKFYESRNDDGSTSDLRPFFPMTPYLALADVIVKMTTEDAKPIDMKEFLEAFTGAQFRTGASSFVVENFAEVLRGGDELTEERLYEMAGSFVGELFGGAATPARVVRDIQAAYDTEAAVVRDAKQTEGIGGYERFTSALKNTLAKDIPGLAKTLPAIESPTRESDIYRQSPLIGQVTGVRREAKRNPAEEELVRLGIKSFQIVPSSGDKTVDASVKKALGPIVEKRISELVTSERYLNKSEPKKRAMLNQYLKMYRARANQIAKIEAMLDKEKSYTPFDRAEYTKLSDLQSKLADEYYKEKYGKSVIEMQELEPDKNHLKRAVAIGRRLSNIAE